MANQQRSPEKESAVSPAIAKDTAVQVPPRGVEGTTDFPSETKISDERGAKSGAVSDDADHLGGLIASLTQADLAILLAFLRARS